VDLFHAIRGIGLFAVQLALFVPTSAFSKGGCRGATFYAYPEYVVYVVKRTLRTLDMRKALNTGISIFTDPSGIN
jgi:hypothetical protein